MVDFSQQKGPKSPCCAAALFLVKSRCLSSVSDHLAALMDQWRVCAVQPWVLSSVPKGYRQQFTVELLTFNGVLTFGGLVSGLFWLSVY